MIQFLQLFSDDKSIQDFSIVIQCSESQHTSSFNNDSVYNFFFFIKNNQQDHILLFNFENVILVSDSSSTFSRTETENIITESEKNAQ